MDAKVVGRCNQVKRALTLTEWLPTMTARANKPICFQTFSHVLQAAALRGIRFDLTSMLLGEQTSRDRASLTLLTLPSFLFSTKISFKKNEGYARSGRRLKSFANHRVRRGEQGRHIASPAPPTVQHSNVKMAPDVSG
jgi:hypothetical protein